MSKNTEPKIRMVRAYQAVAFEKQNETTFIVKGTDRKKPCSIVINTELHGVEIKSDKDHVLIPMTNISCIYFESPQSVKEEEDKKKEAARVKKQIENNVQTVKKPR